MAASLRTAGVAMAFAVVLVGGCGQAEAEFEQQRVENLTQELARLRRRSAEFDSLMLNRGRLEHRRQLVAAQLKTAQLRISKLTAELANK